MKNKLGFVDVSIAKPDRTNLDLLQSWNKKINMVISWLLNSISIDIYASLIFANSTHEIWVDLRDRFQHKNGLRIFQILTHNLMNLAQDQCIVSS